jgi:hypothetical protein
LLRQFLGFRGLVLFVSDGGSTGVQAYKPAFVAVA